MADAIGVLPEPVFTHAKIVGMGNGTVADPADADSIAKTALTTSGTTATLNLPAVVIPGSILAICVQTSDLNRSFPSQAGYISISFATGVRNMGILYKIADGSEAGGTQEFTYNGGTASAQSIAISFTDIDVFSPFGNTSVGQAANADPWVLTAGDLTRVNVHSRILLIHGITAVRTLTSIDSSGLEFIEEIAANNSNLRVLIETQPSSSQSRAYELNMNDTRAYEHFLIVVNPAPPTLRLVPTGIAAAVSELSAQGMFVAAGGGA